MTDKILWSDAYLIGIEEIDIQHKYPMVTKDGCNSCIRMK